MGTADFTAALASYASGVTLVTIRDGDDDVGITSTAFAATSLDPPMVSVAINSESYLDEVLTDGSRWAATILAGGQIALASRFAVAGRPSARLLLADLPHRRGTRSGALVADGGVAALECRTALRVAAGDHSVLIGRVENVEYVDETAVPLVYLRRRYRPLR